MLTTKRFFALLFLGLTISLSAQTSPTSTVSGVVRDASGGAVPAAQVIITNTDTGAVRTVSTGNGGEYNIGSLPSGPYKLTISHEGFSTYNQIGIVLQVNSSPEIPVTLVVGAVSQEIQVTSDAALVETQSTGVGQVIDQKSVVDLPLNGRNAAQLIALSGASVSGTPVGGTAISSPGAVVQTLDYPSVSAYSVAGAQANNTNYFLDGASYLDIRTNVGLPLPYPDALLEFKVETSSLPASFGALAGGAVSAVTRSGTNQFHGGAFEFIRNGAVNARNYFATARDTLKRNQFGGQIGGPIIKNKLFFFAGVQATRERTSPPSTVAFVPNAAVLAGNFQTLLSTQCQATAVTLPASIATNNILNPGQLNQVALNLSKYLPLSTDPCGKVTYAIPASDNEFQGIGRIDFQRNAKDLISGRLFITDYFLKPQFVNNNLLTTTAGLYDRVTALNLGDTYVLSPKYVNAFRFYYNRSAVRRSGPPGVPTVSQLGSNVTTPVPNYLGQFVVSSYFTQAAQTGFVFNNTYGVTDDFSWSLQKHQIALGFSFLHSTVNGLSAFQENPRYTFDGTITGNALADLMTGNVDTFLQGNGQIADDHVNTPAAYVQDSWKVTPKFLLNYGVRWDPFVAQKEQRGYASNFNAADFAAGIRSNIYINAPAGVSYPGDPGFHGNSDTASHYGQFAPRIGFSYDIGGRGRQVIRGGYGFFYSGSFLWETVQTSTNAPWGNTLQINGITTAKGGLTNPYASYPGGNPFPTPAPSKTVAFPVGASYFFEPRSLTPPRTQQYNLAFQTQVGANASLAVTYLGNVSTHQWLAQELNPAVYAPGATSATTSARRRFNTINPTSGPLFGATGSLNDIFYGNYNGLLVSANRRFANHFSVIANYTYSHCLDEGENNQNINNGFQNPDNPTADYANCALDRRNIANVSGIGTVPHFSNKLLTAIASDWTGSLIYTFSSGAWVTPLDGADVSLTAIGFDRPNVVGPINNGPKTVSQWFNVAAFSKQTVGTFGNAARDSVLSPSTWDTDAGLWRTFRFEKVSMDIRAEAFNVFNHTRLASPNVAAIASSSFGKITAAGDPRILQGAVKFNF